MNNKKLLFAITSLLSVAMLTGCVGDVIVPVGGASWLNNDRRTANALVDDQAITAKANIALQKDKRIWREGHISTLTYNGSLLLVGQVPTKEDKKQVEDLVAPISGVTKIYNQVTIGAPISVKARACDTWITTQVKTRLVGNRNIGLNRVKVITENKVVYLMGMLTPDEEQITIDIARRVPSVERVVTVIEKAEKGIGCK